jgi:hypothetical protein
VSVLQRLKHSALLRSAARVGLVGRGVLYLVLAGLALNLVIGPPGAEEQANANGALRAVGQTPLGTILLLAAAIGFAAYAVARLVGAATDADHGRLRRLSTAGQGLAYVALAWGAGSFLLGQEDAGSEQQQEQTAGAVLGLPGGRVLVAAAGLVVLGICAWQLKVAGSGHFADSLRSEQMSRPAKGLVWLVARVGIAARAVASAPVGVFLVLAGLRSSAEQAGGLDAFLLTLTDTGWGRFAVVLVAAGFAVFAVYSLLEARYRDVAAGA